MWTHAGQSKGGTASALLTKKKAAEAYNANPKICLNCLNPIPLKGRRPSKVKKNKFCSLSCAAIYNNRKFPKVKSALYNRIPTAICKNCGEPIPLKKRTALTYYNRKKCDKCKYIRGTPPVKLGAKYLPKIAHKTKKEMFSSSITWQSARSQILKHAFITYHLSDRPKECAICGYKKHFQVSHIKAVADFSEGTLISEINSLKNLIALCPTHHWEYDHNCLDNPQVLQKFIHEMSKN